MPVDGLPAKNLMGQPWRAAFALQDDGWILRSAIVWHKPNPMPESVSDRPTSAYEMVFLLTKRAHYFYDADAIRAGCCGNATIVKNMGNSNGHRNDRGITAGAGMPLWLGFRKSKWQATATRRIATLGTSGRYPPRAAQRPTLPRSPTSCPAAAYWPAPASTAYAPTAARRGLGRRRNQPTNRPHHAAKQARPRRAIRCTKP